MTYCYLKAVIRDQGFRITKRPLAGWFQPTWRPVVLGIWEIGNL
jgi:hypothetical protein